MTNHTTPDNLPYPGPLDGNDPADLPVTLGASMQATQIALNNRLTTAAHTTAVGNARHGFTSTVRDESVDGWNEYQVVTVDAPGWQPMGRYASLAPILLAGTWIVTLHSYLEVLGGNNAPQSLFLGIDAEWSDGAGMARGDLDVTVARLTAPEDTEITITGITIAKITNSPLAGRRLKIRPCGQIGAPVAGSRARMGFCRMTAQFIPNTFNVGTVWAW